VVALPARELLPWVDDADVEPIDDRTSRLRVGSWSWMGVLAALTRFDAPFQIVGPPALREAASILVGRLDAAAAERPER
jgi:hypothetical protein